MSQFESIDKVLKKERLELQEVKKRMNNNSNNNSNNNTRTKNQQRTIKKELIGNPTKKDQKGFEQLVSDAEKKRTEYKDNLARSKGITGKNPGKQLEKQIDIGAKKQDGVIGKRTPSKAFAQGEPFQPDNNPYTKSGKYPTSGETILNKRYQYQTDIKGSERAAVKSRLANRIKYVEDPKFGDSKTINKFVDDVTKGQKLSKAKGTKSTLYKTLKKYVDAKEPTIKGASGGKLPMPDGPKRDALVKKNLAKFDADIAKKAKIPKGTVIPKGGVFPSSNIKTKKPNPFSAPLEPKELNLQYKADKLRLDYGGRIGQRDGLTKAERARKLKDIKRNINIKNPTVTSTRTGLPLPKGNTAPQRFSTYKFDDKNIRVKLDKAGKKVYYDKTRLKTINPKKLTSIAKPITQTATKTATKTGKNLFTRIATKIPKAGKVGLAIGGAALLYSALKGDNKSKNPGGGPIALPPPPKNTFKNYPISLRLGSKKKELPTASNPTANTTRLNSLTNQALLAKQNRNS